MNNMTATLETHPLAVGSDGFKNFLFLEGKVNSQSSADDHESVYNVKFTTTLGFTLTMGYSRYNDQVGTTHAWIAFGELCSSRWQKELGVDLLLNLVGYRCVYGSDHKVLALSSSVHPAEAPAQPSASSSTPALAQAPVPSAQPLAATMLASSSVPEPAQAPASSAQPLAAMPSTSMAASSVSTTAQAPAPSAQPPASMVASSATAPAPAQAPAPSAQPGGASSVAPTSQPLAGMPCAQPPASMVASSATAPAPAQAPAPSAQPLAGGASSVAPPSQPLAGMPLGSKAPLHALASKPLAGLPLMQVQAKEQEDEGKDETDHEGLDVRPCLGEQDPEVLEQERQRLEDLARSGEDWDSEAEELAFKNKVSAVTRERPPDSRMFLVPKARFKPAVGGAGGQQGPAVGGQDGGVSMDMRLHMSVLSTYGGTQDFGLQEMTCKYDGNKYFVPWMNHKSTSRKFDILQREPDALKGSDMGGWRLCDELADTDFDGGKAMSWEKFRNPSRWRGDTALVLKHLFRKHEGELVEVVGKWVEGTGNIPDPLFDPQFTQNWDDFKLCKSLDQPLAISRSQYSHSYLAKGKVHRGGKGKGQKGKGKEEEQGQPQPAVGGKGKHQPAVGGKPGGKSQQLLQMSRGSGSPELHTNALQMRRDGTWSVREGKCISLPQLFQTMGREYNSVQLYEYWHQLRPLACKRPHAWTSPWRQQAVLERYKATGRYGHGK